MLTSSPTWASEPTAIESALRQFLTRSGLASTESNIVVATLPGGVSCDVWKVTADGRTFVVKRALPRLRVTKLWEAPVGRGEAEWNWLTFAHSVVPNAVPRALAHDAETGMIAIEYLDPEHYPVWKEQLFAGATEPNIAAAVASIIVRVHAASAGNPDVAAQFCTAEAFYALRIEPYLLEAARQNRAVSDTLSTLAEQTLQTQIALVHGDLSPKNILVGPEGPVILDAETAWYGDPAFDAAFCLNHLLLKCVARPAFADGYLACFESFRSAYLAGTSWEAPGEIESRVAKLLPALLLARVDGKSPVEYLAGGQRNFVRQSAIELIRRSPIPLEAIAGIWKDKIKLLSAAPPQTG